MEFVLTTLDTVSFVQWFPTIAVRPPPKGHKIDLGGCQLEMLDNFTSFLPIEVI